MNLKKKRNLNKQHARPAPTGTGHAIGWHGGVEDIKEPMHTNFGVPGLSGYPTIQYFVPVLTKHWRWGVPYWHFWWFD